jgi:hypothetical protein
MTVSPGLGWQCIFDLLPSSSVRKEERRMARKRLSQAVAGSGLHLRN